MDHLGIRQLRNATADAVRRAGNGERIVITVDGHPVAQLGPVEPLTADELTLDDLIARGAVLAPRDERRPAPDAPLAPPLGARIDRAAAELRGDAGRRTVR
ncbi:MAG: type II toxin-antitoxin system prevent-host-death family antitoxin [Actinobacteria bacterium]|nr:type II toxin-antitoxin system prevent-host-death family antitoxin [Actinomycetota bacterium]